MRRHVVVDRGREEADFDVDSLRIIHWLYMRRMRIQHSPSQLSSPFPTFDTRVCIMEPGQGEKARRMVTFGKSIKGLKLQHLRLFD